ncbi:cache domain-containing protein, partial [archaeon]|nr:cache domain-containing protein [archaeon]
MAKRILSNISISKKLILIFLAIVLFSTSISGYLGYLNSKKIVEERIQDQLLSVLVLKENSMENFFKLLREDIENFAGNKEIKAYFEEFHFSTNKVNPELEELKEEEIELYFREELIHHAHFLEIFLLDVNGKIDISTEANQKGKIKSSDDIFLKGKERTYIKNIYY